MAKNVKKKKGELTETEKQQTQILLEGLKNYASDFKPNQFARDLMLINIPQKQLSSDWFVNLVDLFRMMKYPSFSMSEAMQDEISKSNLRDIAASLIKQKVADFAMQTSELKELRDEKQIEEQEPTEVKPINKLFL